jgi:hypothetical protein
VLLSAVGTAEAADVSPESAVYELTESTVVFLNNKLVGEPGEALPARCASIAGLRKVQWKRECGLALQSAGDSIQLSGERGCPLRGLRIALHLRSAQHCPLVRFGDLAKTFVMPSESLVGAIGTAIEGALRRAHQALVAQGCPVPKSGRRARDDRQSAAAIASSVGGMLSRSRDDSLMRECCKALQLGDEAEDTLDGGARTADLATGITAALLKLLERDWSEVFDSRSRGSGGGGGRGGSGGGGGGDGGDGGGAGGGAGGGDSDGGDSEGSCSDDSGQPDEAVRGSHARDDRGPQAIPPPARAVPSMDEEEEEDEDAMDEKQRTGPMTAREMEEAVEATLNVLFHREGVDDVPFDQLYQTLKHREPRATESGREAVEETLVHMEAANKVMHREGRVYLI